MSIQLDSPNVARANVPRARRAIGMMFGALVTLGLCIAHTVAIWEASGGWREISSPWPLAMHDHPLHFHSSTLAPAFFRQSFTNAGYDASFMAGYPKSVIFPESATMYDVAAIVTRGATPPQTHKMTVFLATAALPWLVALACVTWRLGAGVTTLATLFFLIFAWSDGGGAGFPLNYARYGMTSYLLVVPLGLLTLALFTKFLEHGGFFRWFNCTFCAIVLLMVHATSTMVVGPALAAVYVADLVSGGGSMRKHTSVVLMAMVALAVNAFWWWPGVCLASMRGSSSTAFIHSEGPWMRLWQILVIEPPAQIILVALGVVGICLAWPRVRKSQPQPISKLTFVSLLAFAIAGLLWGYMAALAPELDFLQPGRHTYALYTALCVFGAIAVAAAWNGVRVRSVALALVSAIAFGAVGFRLFADDILGYGAARVREAPFLSSKPLGRLRWLVDQLKAHVAPGSRLLYEESGVAIDAPDPYLGGRFSGLLPYLTGVEVLGGPYLHAGIKTNFTQFGENRLFGRAAWDAEFFRKYAEIYRPTAIVCWSPHALAFCEQNPELVEIVARDERMVPMIDPKTKRVGGVKSLVILGLIRGYDGPAVRGRASVRAEPGRLHIDDAVADELDGLVVLGYHFVPRLRATPPVRLEAVRLGNDPVPFIGIRNANEPVTLEMDFGAR